jgi:aminopeptidase YwaD
MKRPMAALAPLALALAAIAAAATAQTTMTLPAETLLDRQILRALDEELSGVAAKDHVSRLAQLHRVPASPGFHEAIEYVMDRAKAFGLADVHVETFPGDGTTWFGTLHGNRGWRVDGGFLDEIRPQPRRIISYDDVRLAVADNSESADVSVDLVDVGRGTDRRDY